MTDLKPCPICGGKAKIKRQYILGIDHVIFCQSCRAEWCDLYTPKDTLVEKWNKRAEEWSSKWNKVSIIT